MIRAKWGIIGCQKDLEWVALLAESLKNQCHPSITHAPKLFHKLVLWFLFDGFESDLLVD